ncbi:hypothetical protein [Lewinella sp. 4G2]|uniref:hypothetical protein n=1 Tax=Lewinella sp. 4G2 TaxID=1803372 RepID=UPI0007B4B6CB|nr:hypothetical protein [Lewinella sp. 4G2]OAV45073.1 hypothetical protein A3850_011505 [Lewinella sp. 4G2]
MTTGQEKAKILSKIWKKNKKKKRKCLAPECYATAINSHLLQKKGILSQLQKDGKISVLGHNSFFSLKNFLKIETVGLNAAMSLNLFCSYHDDDLFSEVEKRDFNEYEYQTQLLFSYRSVCCELRKKQIQFENTSEVCRNERMTQLSNEDALNNMIVLSTGFQMGIRDLLIFKSALERDLYYDEEDSFQFYTYTFNKLGVCCSAFFSPTNIYTDPIQFDPFDGIIVNVFPHNNKTTIIIGYHKSFNSPWITDYCNKFGHMTELDFEYAISNLLIKRCETWAMSPYLLQSMSEKKKQQLLTEFKKDVMNLEENMKSSINIFKN